MGCTQHLARHAELVAETDVQPVRNHHKTGGNLPAVGKRYELTVLAGRDGLRFGVDERHTARDIAADRVDQCIIADAMLIAAPLFHHAAEPRHPGFPVVRGGAQHSGPERRGAQQVQQIAHGPPVI